MFKTRGRMVALTSAAVMLFAACSAGATAVPSVAPVTAAPTTAAPASVAPSSAAPITVGYLPKDIVNQYFAAAKTGVDKAATELGGTVTEVGPNTPTADLQIPFI